MEYRCQRAISRVRRSHPLTFRTRWPQRSGMEGRMQDISLHGLKFLSSCALAPGQIIRVDSEICRAVARVLAAQPAGSGSAAWVVRAEFLTLDLERSVGTFVSEVA